MPDSSYLDWPFFDASHRTLALDARTAARQWMHRDHHADAAARTRQLVRQLGSDGWLRHAVPAAYGGAGERLDVRTICLLRESFAYADGLADFAFAMQGLGTGAITLFGTEDQRRRYLPPVMRGDAIAAFAISESDAGSDVAAMQCTARTDGDHFIIDGGKTWISNAGIADHYVIVTRFPEQGERAYCAFIVDASTSGLHVTDTIEVNAPHVLGTLHLDACRVHGDALIGDAGAGLRVALGTLDIFRSTVGAAALGFARRALDVTLDWCSTRMIAGRALAEYQLTQARIAEMAVAIDTSALLVYRAAWTRDNGAPRVTREAAMAKLHATDTAQQVIDDAVQLAGARGVVAGSVLERLMREVRALRIYEGTSEIQKLVIAGQVLTAHTEASQ